MTSRLLPWMIQGGNATEPPFPAVGGVGKVEVVAEGVKGQDPRHQRPLTAEGVQGQDPRHQRPLTRCG